MTDVRLVPFQIDVNRVIEVLASQIYQSPLALLRENCQNAFDAIQQRRYLKQRFDPQIDIEVSGSSVTVRDNGIGMTSADLVEHYWRAGASGKNTPEARAAGVVGTFGIGAMANFGVAESLTLETESAVTGERTRSFVERAKLSTSRDCISIEGIPPTGSPGTSVTAKLAEAHQVSQARAAEFLKEFVAVLDVPVRLNGVVISLGNPEGLVSRPEGQLRTWNNVSLTPSLSADIEVGISQTGSVWAKLQNLRDGDSLAPGLAVLRQDARQIRAYRSWFGLAAASVFSRFGFGGVVNSPLLQPTAGREALTTESIQFLQAMVSGLEAFVCKTLYSELSSAENSGFLEWVSSAGLYELCGRLRIRTEPGEGSLELERVRELTSKLPGSMFSYDGADSAVLEAYGTPDKPVCVISRTNPRRRCESSYLSTFCKCDRIDDRPKVRETRAPQDLSLEESALVMRILGILSSDYFVSDSEVLIGSIIPRLPILVSIEGRRARIVLDPTSETVKMILQVYRTEPAAFTSLVKDFVRTAVFPRISGLVPSSTREGADAFLKLIQRPREVFEYDIYALGTLPEIWRDYLDGKITLGEAANRSVSVAKFGVQVVDRAGIQPAVSLIPDVIANEERLEREAQRDPDSAILEARPSIVRLDKESNAKILTISVDEPAVNGYRCFVALSEAAYKEYSRFFNQPHRTEIVWSGQKVLYVFQHHSGAFGLYYELQSGEILSPESGGRAFPTSTVVIKNQVFIPVPENLQSKFIPEGEARKRFDVRCDLLYLETEKAVGPSHK